jgi:hypothetical protein
MKNISLDHNIENKNLRVGNTTSVYKNVSQGQK